MDKNTIAELVSALHDAGMGVNVIVLELKEDSSEEEEEAEMPFWDVDSLGLMGGGSGGGASMDGILQGVNTP